MNGKSGVVVLRAQDVGALPRPAQPVAGSLLRVLSVNPDTGALLTDTTPPPDLTPYVRSSTLPDAKTPGPVRIDPQYGVAVREDATLTLVPASAEQLDSMTDGFAPLTPALLPYGVKKALTTASTAAGWTGAEKTAALRTLGADLTAYYTRLEADAKFGTPYTLPPATADQLGGVKVGKNLTITPDGLLSGLDAVDSGAIVAANWPAGLGATKGTCGYIRFSNGIQICGGRADGASFHFPVPFANNRVMFACSNTKDVAVTTTFLSSNGNSYTLGYVIAIGCWK